MQKKWLPPVYHRQGALNSLDTMIREILHFSTALPR